MRPARLASSPVINVVTTHEWYDSPDGNTGLAPVVEYEAQQFTPGTVGAAGPYTMRYVTLRMYRVGTGGSTLRLQIVDDDGTDDPDLTSVLSTQLLTLSSIATDQTGFGTLHTFELATPVVVQNATKYWITLNQTGADGSNKVQLAIDCSSPGYAGGGNKSSADNGVTWTASFGCDLSFYIRP